MAYLSPCGILLLLHLAFAPATAAALVLVFADAAAAAPAPALAAEPLINSKQVLNVISVRLHGNLFSIRGLLEKRGLPEIQTPSSFSGSFRV